MRSRQETGSGIPRRTADRIARLRAKMKELKLDGYLVVNRMDQFWLTGFTGEDGQVLVTPGDVTLLTDGRFDETAQTEAPWAKRLLRIKRGPEWTVKTIKKHKLAKVGFEPGHLSVLWYTEIAKGIKPGKLVSASGVIGEMRMCKDAEEVNAIRSAIRLAQQAFENVTREIRPGTTEAQLAARLTFEMRSLGAQGDAFAPIVATGATSSLPHYEPSTRVLNGEGVLIDWGCRMGWYVSDLTRMVWPGSIPPRLGKAAEAVRAAHDAAIAAIRPGVKAAAIDKVARETVRKFGFDKEFNHALGHGIGLDVHEAPRLGKKSKDVLKAGMVVTVEPGVYLPGVGGVRLEDDVLVTASGYEVLTSLPL
jgi:Xaa-Pro aminopeptidase